MDHAEAVAPRALVEVPADLRPRLEAARLDLLALFRALDQMDLSSAEIPQLLIQQLFELDADYVEALWALDQPRRSLDWHAMRLDTLASLEQLPAVCTPIPKISPPPRPPHTRIPGSLHA